MVAEQLQELPLPCSRSRSFEWFLFPSSLRLRVHRPFFVMSLFVCLSTTFIPVPRTFSTSSEQTQGRGTNLQGSVTSLQYIGGTWRWQWPARAVFSIFSRLFDSLARLHNDFASRFCIPRGHVPFALADSGTTFRAWRARNGCMDLPDEEDTLNKYHVHVFGKDLTLYKRWAKEAPQSGT
jgi:hypothetical protein